MRTLKNESKLIKSMYKNYIYIYSLMASLQSIRNWKDEIKLW